MIWMGRRPESFGLWVSRGFFLCSEGNVSLVFDGLKRKLLKIVQEIRRLPWMQYGFVLFFS